MRKLAKIIASLFKRKFEELRCKECYAAVGRCSCKWVKEWNLYGSSGSYGMAGSIFRNSTFKAPVGVMLVIDEKADAQIR